MNVVTQNVQEKHIKYLQVHHPYSCWISYKNVSPSIGCCIVCIIFSIFFEIVGSNDIGL